MDEEQKKRLMLFRFGVIADFVGARQLTRGETIRLLLEKSGQRWEIPESGRSSISVSTIKNWIRRYRASGNKLESLVSKGREDKGRFRSIDGEMALGMIALRKQFLQLSIPVFLREARERKIIPLGTKIPESTLYRFLKQHQLLGDAQTIPQDRRKFEAEYPNDLWQSDVMHGPRVQADGKQRKTYLIAFIDDMSRLILDAEFYLQEHLENYLAALRKALVKRGVPRKLYVDNGPAFRSQQLEFICASLGIVLIHAKPYQPEGKGKIERWFRTVRGSFLAGLNTDTLTLEELNKLFEKWLMGYQDTKHHSTGETPVQRFMRNVECLRSAPQDIDNYFRKVARRTVRNDRTLAFKDRLYEAPVELIGRQIQLLYHEHDLEKIEILWNGKTYGMLGLVDAHVNYRILRTKKNSTEIIPQENNQYSGGTLFKINEGDNNHEKK